MSGTAAQTQLLPARLENISGEAFEITHAYPRPPHVCSFSNIFGTIRTEWSARFPGPLLMTQSPQDARVGPVRSFSLSSKASEV